MTRTVEEIIENLPTHHEVMALCASDKAAGNSELAKARYEHFLWARVLKVTTEAPDRKKGV